MIHPNTYQAYRLLHDGVLALARAEQQGIRIDLPYAVSKKDHLTRRINRLEKQFKETDFFDRWKKTTRGTVNIHSPQQLSNYLYRVLKIKPSKETPSGHGATDEDTLRQLGIKELNDLLDIRKLKRIRDTYLDGFIREQVNGYIHPFFNLHLVRTYRSSSDSPNFQNIPKRDKEAMLICRNALYPRPGHHFLEIDYSGLEVRIAACYHKDTTMLKYLREGYDMHGDMAMQIFMLDEFDKKEHDILRQAAKNGFVFPEFYGDYYVNCANFISQTWCGLPQGKWTTGQGIKINGVCISDHLISKGILSLSKFTEHLKKIEDNFWGVRFVEYAEWKERWYKVYKKYGYFDTLTGFRCSDLMSRNDAINYPVQGSAFHCLLWSFIEIDRILKEIGADTKLIGQIHDSIILDVNPVELDMIISLVKRVTCMDLPKMWDWIIVPLDIEIEICDVDKSWAEKRKLKYE